MGLRIYDTLAGYIRDFHSLQADKASIYLCGPTTLTSPHIGQLRSAVSFDLLRRWLSHQGYDVTFCRNVTDIEDKIIQEACLRGIEWWRITEPSYRSFSEAFDTLGCLPPSIEPRATGHIPEVIALVSELVARNNAYVTASGVYFDVSSFPQYGALSRRSADTSGKASEGDNNKRNPLDFVLWKSAKAGEPTWESPWGAGRPGWHIECSAMASRYLGDEFDIHAGGLDLIFPHHENELAQAHATGMRYCRYWLHNGRVTKDGDKVRKAVGNPLSATEIFQHARPVELRYYLSSVHYRSDMEFSYSAVQAAAKAFTRIERFIFLAAEYLETDTYLPNAGVPAEFAESLDNDLAMPAALRVLHRWVHKGNAALIADDRPVVRTINEGVRSMLAVIGLDPLAGHWGKHVSAARNAHELDALVGMINLVRDSARTRGDYALADELRTGLRTLGIRVHDARAARIERRGASTGQ